MPRYLQIAAITITLLLLYLAWKFIVPEVLVVIKYLFVITIPFILAVILAVFIEPLVKFFNQRARLTRPLAVAAAMVILIGGLGSLLSLLIFRLVAELTDLSIKLPKYIWPVQEYISQLVERGRVFYFQLPPLITDRIQENIGVVTKWLSGLAGQAANALLHLASAVPGAVMILIVTLLATYFISRDRKEILQFWLKYVPSPWGERTAGVGREVVGAFLAYLRAQLILISLTTLQSIVGLQIIGAKYALTVGLLIGFFDLIPVLGPATVYLPWAAWALLSGNVGFGIKLLILYALVWAVRQILEARVVAANLGLHPLAVLIAMYVGLKTIGVTGLVLGPILLITVLAALKAGMIAKKQG
ncbi:MAG: sporulation integral membrane protein YtvI [Bacillota bacterium]